MALRQTLYRQSKPSSFLLSSQKRTVSQPPGRSTPRIINAIKKDHRKIESCYERITKSADKDEQTRYQNLFTWELARHSIGEEFVVYPAFEKHINDGKVLADNDRREHQSDLAQHIHEEETSNLVKLESALSEQESMSVSKSFGRTKMFVPSRSHPSAPSKPPFETAIGLLTAPIDHLADLFRQWPDTTTIPNRSTK